MTIDTDVLIVGAGPIGLALALDLRFRGVDFRLIEQTAASPDHPRVGTVGVRSMELFRRWGVAAAIREAGWPPDHSLDIAWVTSVGGHELFRLHFPPFSRAPLPAYSPELEQVCPHHWLVPLLVANIGVAPNGPIHLRQRVDAIEQTARGVRTTVVDVETGARQVIESRFVAACDGSHSPLRKMCSIDAPALYPTRVFQNILFHSPELEERLGSSNALVFFLTTPTLRYPLRNIDGRGLFRLTVSPRDGWSSDPRGAVRQALNEPVSFEVVSSAEWHLTHRVAARFREGNVFLVGDAAHVLSPSGGFGMNTGIADAADLGWKLAAKLQGWAGERLLDSYELERRPIAVRNLEEANANLERTLSRELPAELLDETPQGERARAKVSERLRLGNVRTEFDAPGVHLGFRYESPLILGNGSPPLVDVHAWKQTTYPGSRAPHAWLPDGRSTLDLFGREFVLLHAEPEAALEGFVRAARERRVPLSLHPISGPVVRAAYEDRRFVLVRPDGHVAWAADVLPAQPDGILDAVIGGVRS